tara:strand:- start:253 stop:534 length:282 start_codon:yes stop_codon:yes gene_type:complete
MRSVEGVRRATDAHESAAAAADDDDDDKSGRLCLLHRRRRQVESVRGGGLGQVESSARFGCCIDSYSENAAALQHEDAKSFRRLELLVGLKIQ